jgi:hypothetical protein
MTMDDRPRARADGVAAARAPLRTPRQALGLRALLRQKLTCGADRHAHQLAREICHGPWHRGALGPGAAARHPAAALENVQQALRDRALGACGRYGLSNGNLDRNWVGPDMIGVDAGAAVLALDNLFMAGRVRSVFHQVGCVRAGCERLGFVLRAPASPAWRAAS